MAKVLNMYGYPISLVAKDGDSCQIPVGESKVQDKFCANVPPKVKVLEIKKPVAKAPVIKSAPQSSMPKLKEASKKSEQKVNKEEE